MVQLSDGTLRGHCQQTVRHRAFEPVHGLPGQAQRAGMDPIAAAFFHKKRLQSGKTDYSPLNRFQFGQLYLRRRETKPIAPRPSKIIEDGSGTASVPVKVKFKSLGVDTPLEALAKLEDESVLSKAPFKFRS